MSTQKFAGLRFQPGAAIVSGVVVTAAFGEKTQYHRDDVLDIATGKRPHDSITPEAAARAEAEFERFYALSKSLVGRYNVASEHKAMEAYLAGKRPAFVQAEGAEVTL